MSVCGCGSASSSILTQYVQQQLQGMAPQQQTQDAATTPNGRESLIESAAAAAGIDPSVLSGLRGEIESAIQTAIQNSDGTTNRRAAVKSAIDGVLQSHGIDAASLRSQLQSLLGAHGVHRGGHASAIGAAQTAPNSRANSLSALLAGQDDGDGDSDSLNVAATLQGLPAGSLVNVNG